MESVIASFAGYGDGYGDGYGYGYGSGYGIKSICGEVVYRIDCVPTVIRHVHGNIAKGGILMDDMSIKPCYIVKQDGLFAHGDTLRAAMNALTDKLMDDMPEEERVDAFVKAHKDGEAKYPNKDFFAWHHRLTGSCEEGRIAFAKNHGVDMNGTMTVMEFIFLTENSYGGHIIKKLRRYYDAD